VDLAGWIDAYLDHLRVERSLAGNTLEAYARDLNALADQVGEACAPSAIGAEALASLMVKNVERGFGARSCARQLSALRGFFRFLVRERAILEDPTALVDRPTLSRKLPRVLSFDEVERLLAAPDTSTDRGILHAAMLHTMYASGLRVSELCALRVEHIDSAADRMCVHVVQGKGARDRYVPLGGDLLALLRRYWQTCRPRQWLFGPRAGQPRALHVQLAQRTYCRARDAAGITKVGGIHTLRHCYATHLLEAGVDLYSLQQWLGHNHVSTTTRYLHLAQPGLPDGARREPLALLTALPAMPMH
jgi:integrase/recombinase XerD